MNRNKKISTIVLILGFCLSGRFGKSEEHLSLIDVYAHDTNKVWILEMGDGKSTRVQFFIGEPSDGRFYELDVRRKKKTPVSFSPKKRESVVNAFELTAEDPDFGAYSIPFVTYKRLPNKTSSFYDVATIVTHKDTVVNFERKPPLIPEVLKALETGFWTLSPFPVRRDLLHFYEFPGEDHYHLIDVTRRGDLQMDTRVLELRDSELSEHHPTEVRLVQGELSALKLQTESSLLFRFSRVPGGTRISYFDTHTNSQRILLPIASDAALYPPWNSLLKISPREYGPDSIVDEANPCRFLEILAEE